MLKNKNKNTRSILSAKNEENKYDED